MKIPGRALCSVFLALSFQQSPATPTVTIPAGKLVAVRTIDSIDSRTDRVGQTFRATLDSDLVVAGAVVAPLKTDAYLRLTQVSSAGDLRGKSELRLELESIVIRGKAYVVKSDVIERSAGPEGPKTARDVAIGTAIGAAIGGIAGGGKGAAIGAGAGAGSGVVVAAITRGQQILVRSETLLEFRLERPVEIEVSATSPATSATPSTNDRPSSGPRRLGEDSSAPRPGSDAPKQIDLSGEWDLTVDSLFEGKKTMRMFLNQRGRDLTGSIQDDLMRRNLTGSVNKDSISFSTRSETRGRIVRERFTGMIVATRLRGTVMIQTVSATGGPLRRDGIRSPVRQLRGTWTAKRR